MGNRPKPRKRKLIAKAAIAQMVSAPSDEKVVIKEVPAKVDGTVIGTAVIYDDGTVDIMADDDAPLWALEKIAGVAGKIGYSIGGNDDGST